MAPNLVVARSIYQRLQMSAFIKFTHIKSHKHMSLTHDDDELMLNVLRCHFTY